MTFKPQHDPTHLYFITAILLNWLPLFTQPTYADIVFNFPGQVSPISP